MSERTGPSHKAAVTPEERKHILAQAVQHELSRGARVESQQEFSVVVVRSRKIRHGLHLVVTLLTGGSWGLVWLGIVIFGGRKRTALSVDDFGQLLRRKA